MTRTVKTLLSKGEIGVVGFTLVYMAAALIASLMRKNPEFIYYLAVMCVLIVVVLSVHLKVGLHIGALWGLSIWGLAHMAGGLMPVPHTLSIDGGSFVLYNVWLIPRFLKYDQLVHVYGFGLVTWICWQGICKAFARHQVAVEPSIGLLTLCIAGGMGFGAANEVVEFIATITMPSTNVGGYVNTGWDLVSNLVGCVLSAILIKYGYASRSATAT